MVTAYHLQSLAALKTLLHLAKYPHSTVIGVLVGTVERDTVTISDAIPLVHHWLDLSPVLEAGLAMAQVYAKSKQLKIVGTYVAHSRTDLKCLDIVSQRLNESLHFESSIALVIDNQKLNTADSPFIPFTRSKSNDWSSIDSSCFRAAVPQDWLSSQSSIGDFDDHLEDIGVDWLVNPGVVSPT